MKPIKDTLAYCSCQEIKDSQGNEYPHIPQWHNCDYIRKRNKFINDAHEYATRNAMDNGRLDTDKFTNIFSRQMDKMAYESGLVA